jgi:hypothetical protein
LEIIIFEPIGPEPVSDELLNCLESWILETPKYLSVGENESVTQLENSFRFKISALILQVPF